MPLPAAGVEADDQAGSRKLQRPDDGGRLRLETRPGLLPGPKKRRPFYDLLANIPAEDLGHIALVAAVVNQLLVGATETAPPTEAPAG
ncbi:hypothetical protein [Hydrogenibacillus schlegelii]|uniref:hypothetical protein n=1 Tax=Hydrogenibacillus schlegelii TaxID=1484 RepID=UPI0034A0697C